eukprot:8401554-Alexandrium_andersonii.AAC.1
MTQWARQHWNNERLAMVIVTANGDMQAWELPQRGVNLRTDGCGMTDGTVPATEYLDALRLTPVKGLVGHLHPKGCWEFSAM